MIPTAQALYQQTILDHSKNPRNFRTMANVSSHHDAYNPLCGDHLHVYLAIRNGCIQDASFDGEGCAVSKASASIMTELLNGKSLTDAKALYQLLETLLTDTSSNLSVGSDNDNIHVLANVRQFPSRIPCVMLAWQAMVTALEKENL